MFAEAGQLNLPPLLLENRLKITLDIASCLSYLHNGEAIPHGNLKSTNVLLKPPELTAHLTDYSLHRLITPEATSEQVLNAAALGYCPPEFASSSKPYPSLKSDVYAFGVILLELLTGKVSGDIVCSDPGVLNSLNGFYCLWDKTVQLSVLIHRLLDHRAQGIPLGFLLMSCRLL